MLNKKTHLKIRKKNKDKEKGFERKNKTGNPPKEKILMKKEIAIESFDVVPFMKEKQRRQKKNKERKTRNQKKAKKKTRRKNERKEQERDRERETENGGGRKRLRRNKGGDSKIDKKCPFLGGKAGLISIESQERKGPPPKKKQNKKQK